MGKKTIPPSPKEQRFGGKVLIFLGVIWTLGAIIINTVVDGFMPYGLIWYIMSIGFIVWGSVILRKNSKKAEEINKASNEITQDQSTNAIPKQPEKPRLYILINSKNPVLPYLDSERCIHLYKSEKDAYDFAGKNFILDLSVAHIVEEQLPDLEKSWLRYGVKTVKIHQTKDEFTSHSCANTDKDYIGSMVASILLQMYQNEKKYITAEQDVQWKTLQSMLANIIKTTPFLVPFKYGDETDANSLQDNSLHMTTKAAEQLSFLLKKEKELHIFPSYLGFHLLAQGKHGTLWHNDKLIYMGSTKRIDAAAENNDMSLLYPDSNKMMRPMFADNTQQKSHMIAAFTNITDLRRMYPNERVAAFSFDDIVNLTNEGDGIIINPSRTGLCYQMPHSFINEIKKLMKEPIKFYSLPQEYVGKRKVVLNTVGENKIEIIKLLRIITGCNLPQAKEMYENLPSVIKAGIPLGEAQLIVKLLAGQNATSEILPDE